MQERRANVEAASVDTSFPAMEKDEQEGKKVNCSVVIGCFLKDWRNRSV